MSQRFALTVAYDGDMFNGWQTQPDRRSLQDALEAALAAIAGHPVSTVCAGRTDAGVHALSQVVHFESDARRDPSAWTRGVNAHLPAGIAVQWASPVAADFHARFSARRRCYVYLLLRSPHRHPIWHRRAGWVFHALDIDAMRQAALMLEGEHDFSSFRSAQCQARSPVRSLERITLREHGPVLAIELVANAFLHHMVRNIVGALDWVGCGRRPPDWIAQVLLARDRRLAAPTFAADGLYLAGVEYDAGFSIPSWPAGYPPVPVDR